jgi:hypothetical protein
VPPAEAPPMESAPAAAPVFECELPAHPVRGADSPNAKIQAATQTEDLKRMANESWCPKAPRRTTFSAGVSVTCSKRAKPLRA